MANHRVFPARMEKLSQMIEWIREHLTSMSFDDAAIRKVELASEEALVNIIRHGYKKQAGQIEIEFHHSPDQAEIILKDAGPPFNPLLEEIELNHDSSLEEREEGGLGILFMREYMDEVRYRRESNQNILTLIKRLAS